LEFRQLKTFIKVAEQLSFTKAAEKLCLAQSSVSSQIRALEEELDLKLFDRLGRRVFLTDAGRKLFAYARRMETMTLELLSEFSENKYIQGCLTVRVPETLAQVHMPEIIDIFNTAHPMATLHLINCTDQQLREELNSGRIDLAFLLTDAINLKEVNIKMLGSEKLILVAGPDHQLTKQKNISLKDLDQRTLVLPMTD
jgi:DNA-binding transcriptional LysR family regulator